MRPLPLLTVVFVLSCQRRAPGPAECVDFAWQAFGLRVDSVVSPRVRAEVDALTTTCLTEPYDYEMLECTRVTGRRRARRRD